MKARYGEILKDDVLFTLRASLAGLISSVIFISLTIITSLIWESFAAGNVMMSLIMNLQSMLFGVLTLVMAGALSSIMQRAAVTDMKDYLCTGAISGAVFALIVTCRDFLSHTMIAAPGPLDIVMSLRDFFIFDTGIISLALLICMPLSALVSYAYMTVDLSELKLEW